MKVAIQGEAGSNSHLAAMQSLNMYSSTGSALEMIPCSSSADVFEAVIRGDADLAVLPIENSLYGSIAEHDDLLMTHEVRIVGETALRILHNLVVMPNVRLEQIRRVLSHPVALAQCRDWLKAHPAIDAIPFYDTAGGVKHLMATADAATAGIAPALAAEVYGAQVLVPNIEDHHENFTRFYVFSKCNGEPPGSSAQVARADKASLAFRLKHRPGSLVEALEVFREFNLNLTRIASRPVPGTPWEYVFFVDVRFEEETLLTQASEKLAQRCLFVRELGRYRTTTGVA